MKKNILKNILEKLGFAPKQNSISTVSSLKEEEITEKRVEIAESSNWVSADKNTQNIEKSKAAEQKKFSSAQLLRMFESIDDLVVFIDKELNIKYITPSIKDFLGYESEELEDKKFISLLTGDKFLEFNTAIEKLEKGRNKIHAMFSFKTKASIVKQAEIFIKKFDDRKMGTGYLISSRAIIDRTVDITIDEDEINELLQQKHDLNQALLLSEQNVRDLQIKLVKLSESQPLSREYDQGKLSVLMNSFSEQLKNKMLKKVNMQYRNTLRIANKYKDESMRKMDLEEYFTDMHSLAVLNMLGGLILEKRMQLYGYLLGQSDLSVKERTKIYLNAIFERIASEISDVCNNLHCCFDIVGDEDISINASQGIFMNIIYNLLFLIIEHEEENADKFKNYIRFERYDDVVRIHIAYNNGFRFDFMEVNYVEYVKEADIKSYEFLVNSIAQLCKMEGISVNYVESASSEDKAPKQLVLICDV